jgi:hypothetical protein
LGKAIIKRRHQGDREMYENLYVRMNVVREELFFAQRKVKELKKEMA